MGTAMLAGVRKGKGMREYLIVPPWSVEGYRITVHARCKGIPYPRPLMLRNGLQEALSRSEAAWRLRTARNMRGWHIERVA